MICCAHAERKKNGKNRHGVQRYKCLLCGKRFTEPQDRPLGALRVPIEDAKRVLHLLAEGSSIRSAERLTGMHRDTICKLLVHFGNACQRFLDERMTGLTLDHLQFDEQWTYVFKKQARLTTTEREESSEQGDMYLWTAIDQKTKLMPSFLIGKRYGWHQANRPPRHEQEPSPHDMHLAR